MAEAPLVSREVEVPLVSEEFDMVNVIVDDQAAHEATRKDLVCATGD
jgi:hypothetical protein